MDIGDDYTVTGIQGHLDLRLCGLGIGERSVVAKFGHVI